MFFCNYLYKGARASGLEIVQVNKIIFFIKLVQRCKIYKL